MSAEVIISPPGGRALTAGAIALVLMLCLTWGFNQIAIKLVLHDIPPYTQAMLRSAGALLVILAIARMRGVKLFERDGTLKAGPGCCHHGDDDGHNTRANTFRGGDKPRNVVGGVIAMRVDSDKPAMPWTEQP